MPLEPSDKPRAKTSRALIFGVAVAVAAIGPAITHPRERAANAPFVYAPPDGFAEKSDAAPATAGLDAKKWTLPRPGATIVPSLTLTHMTQSVTIDEAQLREMARGMPEAFRASHVTWTERRHEARARADGALVGILYGNASRDVDDAKLQMMQMVFPDDRGTSIVLATYGEGDAAAIEPSLLATADAAKGVALRGPAPPKWLYVAWGGGGLVIALLLAQLLQRRAPS